VAAALLAALVSALVASAVAVFLCRRSTRRLAAGFEQQLVAQRSVDEEAHRVARESARAATEQLTRTGYGYIDRLRSEVESLRTQLADSRIAHAEQVQEFQNQVAALNSELAELRDRLARSRDSLRR
jgi:predicted  nucleic acid-binding Zn-ribbon protein